MPIFVCTDKNFKNKAERDVKTQSFMAIPSFLDLNFLQNCVSQSSQSRKELLLSYLEGL